MQQHLNVKSIMKNLNNKQNERNRNRIRTITSPTSYKDAVTGLQAKRALGKHIGTSMKVFNKL